MSVVWCDDAAREAFATAGLRTLDEFAACRAGEVLTTARTRWLRRLHLAGSEWYVKVQDLRGFRLPLRRWPSFLFRGSSVAREARTLGLLREHGFKTPDLVAHGERRGRLFPELALLVTRGVPGHRDLRAWLASGPPVATARAALDAAEALVARAHERGLVLLGAKYRNLLVPEAGPSGPDDFVILDQPDARRSRSPRLRRKCRALLARDRATFGAGS